MVSVGTKWPDAGHQDNVATSCHCWPTLSQTRLELPNSATIGGLICGNHFETANKASTRTRPLKFSENIRMGRLVFDAGGGSVLRADDPAPSAGRAQVARKWAKQGHLCATHGGHRPSNVHRAPVRSFGHRNAHTPRPLTVVLNGRSSRSEPIKAADCFSFYYTLFVVPHDVTHHEDNTKKAMHQ